MQLLLTNSPEVKAEAVAVLGKLLTNIVRDPHNVKYRAINLSNKTIAEKLLPAHGAFEVHISSVPCLWTFVS